MESEWLFCQTNQTILQNPWCNIFSRIFLLNMFTVLALRSLDAAERSQIGALLRHPGGLLRVGGAG
jgi:hypothetical protein